MAPSRREIFEADAFVWLAEHPAPLDASVVTSLPDLSELPGLTLERFRAWFVDAARRVVRWVPPQGVAVFYQSDVLHAGTWVDKAYLVGRAIEEEGAALVFHKIVCRKPPDTPYLGRPSYSHLLGVAHAPRPVRRPSPDVLTSAGRMPWSKAMGVEACRLACRYLLDETDTRVVVDPFCGHGTVLAVANALGLEAIGVDRSARQCRAARRLVVDLDRPATSEP